MGKEEKEGKQKPEKSSAKNQDDLKKHIDRNEAQRRVLEKMAQVLKEKNK